MKFYIICFCLLSFNFLFAQNYNLSQPETISFYYGFQNKLVPSAPCGEEAELIVNGGNAVKSTWTDINGASYNGYIIEVYDSVKFITITMLSKNKNGAKKSYGTIKYRVNPFPKAVIEGSVISKSSGFKSIISLGANSPLNNVELTIIGGSLIVGDKNFPFVGDRVPATSVSSAKQGQKVKLSINYKVGSSNTLYTTSSELTVKP
jgi:hypothetical protein